MARGQQKVQSQAKAAEKQAKMKKQQGHSANEQKKAAQKALIHVCSVCKVSYFCNICMYIWLKFLSIVQVCIIIRVQLFVNNNKSLLLYTSWLFDNSNKYYKNIEINKHHY